MAVKYDGISESGLNSLNDQEVVSRAKQKLKSDLEAGMVSMDQAMELVNNMKTIEQMSPESNVPQYSMSTLSKIKAAYDKPYIEAQKAAEKAAKATQSSSKSSKSKDEEEAEAEALYQKMMGGENAQSSTNANSAADSTKTDKPAEKEEPEKEKGFLAKAADWLKKAFSKAEQKAFTEDSENSQKQVLSAHPQQQGQGFANIVANAAKQAPTVIKNAVREQGVKATRQQALDAGYSERQADLKAEAFRKMLEENDKEKELKKQTDAVLSQRWEADYGAMLDDLSQTDRDIIKQLSQIEYELDNGTTGGYQHVQYLKKMSDSYRDTLEQHGISGFDLDELVRYQQAQTDNQNTAQAKQERQDYVNEGAGNAALASGRSILEGTVGNIGGYADILAQKADRLITGSKAPVNTNSQAQLASNLADTTRQQVSGNIADTVYQETGNEFLAQLAANGYQLGMSGADSLAAIPLSFVSGGGATVALGLGAANQGFKQAKAQGATDNQALAYGTLAGAAEGLFEKFSLDNIKAMARTDKKGLSNFFLNTLKSMGVEGSEEALTQLSNDFSEMLVLGDNSTLQQVYNDEYARAIAEGLSEAEARERAQTAQATALWQDVGAAALGGAAMGGVMGGGAQLIGKAARGVRNQFTGETEATSDPMQPNVEDSLPSLSNQPTQAADNPAESGAVIQDAEQILPGLGDAAPANNGSGNQEVDTILQKMASGQTLSGKEVETLIQGENRKAVETALGTTLPETKSAARRFVRDLEAKAQAGVADNNEHVEANLPGLQEPLDQQEIPGYTETEMSTGGAENGDYREAAGDRQVPFDTEIYRADQPGDPYVRTGNEPGRSAESDGSITGGQYDSTGDDGIPSDIEPGTAGDSVAYSYARNQSGGNEGVHRVLTGSAEIGKAIQEYGATPIELRDTTSDPQLFSSALEAARQANPHGLMVSGKTVEELTQPGTLTFMSPDNTAGALVTVDGDIEAVFKHPKSKAKGASTSLLLTAIQNGGRKLDCYGADLVSIYNKHGFEAVAMIPWNPEYAPEGWTYGPKDVYVMKLRDGETADSIASVLNLKEAEGGFHRQTQEELDALPEFDDYDSALAYRDSLIQNTGNAEQRLPGLGDDLTGTATNPSVGAAGRGFSWGGEGVAGQVVPSQSNTINNIDRQNLSGADMEIQGGEQSYTHERVSHAERLHEAENVLQTESMEEVMDRLAGKESSTWDADDVVAATTVLNRLTKAMNEIQDKSSDEYRTILLEKLRLADKIQSVATSSGQTLESFKALSSPDKALVSAQKSIKTAADNVEKENPKGFANDVRRLKDAIEKANGNEEEIRSAINNIFGKKKAKSAPVDQFLSILKSGTYSNDAVKEFVASKYGVMPLSTDQANQILTLVGEAEKLPANSKRRVDLETQAAAIAASNVQSSWQDKWDAWRYTAMLGNIRTNVKNAGGNISMALEARAKDVVLAAAEKAADAISKAAGKNGIQRTTSVLNPLSATDRALTGKAFADADENAYRPLTSTSEIFDIAKSSKGQGRVYQGNFLEGLRTASTRALEGGDYSGTLGMLEALDETKLKAINDWVKAGVEKFGSKGFIGVSGIKNNYAHSLASYLKANGYDAAVFDFDTPETMAILEKARAHAIQQALVNTYHADSALADAISDFKRKLSNSESVGGRIAGKVAEGFLPFVKTPVNVINNAIHYSPISFLKLASLDVVGIKKGTKTVNDALEDFASGLTGSLLMAIGAWMYQKGFLVPGMDEDEDKQSKSTGRQAYSLRIPNEDGSFTNYGIDWLTSTAVPLFTGAEWAKLGNGEGTGDPLNDAVTALSHIAEPIINMSLMQGVENALSAVEYAETNKTGAFLSSAATSYVTQGIPTIFGQIARGIDDTRRSTYSDKTGVSGDIAYTQNKIENKLPGLSMTNEPYIDPWGRTESNGGLLYNLLSPGYYSREEMTDVDKALDALYQESESASVLPSLADKKLKLDGEERNLTPEEYTEFATERGQTAYDLLGSLTGSDMFEDMSTEDQVEAVSSMYSLADALAADAQFGDSYEPSSTNQKLMDAYNASGTSGVVNYLSAKNSIVGTGAMGENGQRTVTQADKYRAYTNYSGSADEAIQNYLIAYPSDEKVSAVYKQFGGTAAQAWMKYKLQVDTNGNDSISQAEAKVWLSHSNLTQAQKAWFWQNTNTQWKASSNPFF